ncbi:subtilisin-like protease SBT1.5 [Cryptomeria japonica]|uniref:subtilisin-like protease SBT1.5 n=1 Tax=Cryptomeria japonica TaxID=3369 RepID=UPI0027DA0182|nr:subtilisin-like protease SBT1.5 [Cryptomeria japonica]
MGGSMSLGALATLLLFFLSTKASEENSRKPYIVHMLKSMKPQYFSLHEHWYHSILTHATSNASTSNPSLLLYTYEVVLHGFAAKLTSAEAAALESVDGCLAVTPSSLNKLHTTHSPQFLGLTDDRGMWSQQLSRGEDVIVGMVDTGIWPESESFNDKELGPVPSRWKGECESGEQFNSSMCNRKLIGARFNFSVGYKSHVGEDFISARDGDGHGTHTASIAAGSAVRGASFNGFGKGTAMGMAPASRLAVYKACWGLEGSCDESDVAAAMEKAIQDGVDVISLSIGGSFDNPFYMDHEALAAFGAIEKGVFVSASVGNDGPSYISAVNTAPWITTVGASSIDREFLSLVKLGNGEVLRGSSFYRGPGTQTVPLVYDYCSSLGLDPHLFAGKVVLCPTHENSTETARLVKEAGAAGLIFANSESDGADDLPMEEAYLAATSVSFSTGEKIKAYVNSTGAPTATINPTGVTMVGKATAPIVASFSSRGPSSLYLDVLKPDLIAPGVNILAAWNDGGFKIESGTSMACPHVSGIAALIRAAHPTWSPAAIKSALVTTASIVDNRKQPIKDAQTLQPADPFSMGAGLVNPRAAVDPGLVYDLGPQDYVNYLCGGLNNYTEKQIALLTHKWPPCPKSVSGADLNYPSFSVILKYGERVQVKRRTVTNAARMLCTKCW